MISTAPLAASLLLLATSAVAQEEDAQSSENAEATEETDMDDSGDGAASDQPSGGTASRSSDGVKEFNMIDANGDGVVTQQEYVAFAAEPANISSSEARRLFNIASRGDGQLTHTEFVTPSSELNRVAQEILGPEDGDESDDG